MADFNSQLPVRTENAGDVIVKIADATTPSQQLKVESDGSINVNASFSTASIQITDGTDILAINNDGSINSVVSATNLDIRDLAFATDKVDVTGSEVSLSSGTLAALENINAVVTATDLDVRDLVFATDKVDVTGSEVSLDSATLAALESITVQNGAGASAVNIQDGGNSITVDGTVELGSTSLAALENVTVSATDLDIRDLTHASDSVKVGDGTEFLAINTDGSINVVVQEDVGTEVVNYDTSASIAGGASDNHDFVVTNGGQLFQVLATASGKLKAEVQIETGSATNTFNTVAVAFNSTANPNMEINLAKYVSIPTGARVRVVRTNRDNQAQDVYSTIILLSN